MLNSVKLIDYFDTKESERHDFLKKTPWANAQMSLVAEDCACTY